LLSPGFYQWYFAFVALLVQSCCYGVDLASIESPGMEATLLLHRFETELSMGDSVVESRINRIGLILYEPAYPSFQPGLQIGALEINQSNNPVTAGINVTGNYLGVLFRSLLYQSSHSGIRLESGYTYHAADKLTSNQEINLRWHELLFNIHALLTYGNFNFVLGGYTHLIDGDETAFGPITQTREFAESEKTGMRFGLDYRVDISGKVGFYADSGARQGIGLVFTREF